MSKQCLDIQQMQHLKELDVDTSKANFYWHRTKSLNNYQEWDEWTLHYGVLRLARGFKNCEYVRTFTLQDILDLLPSEIGDAYLHVDKESVSYEIMTCYSYDGNLKSFSNSENLIDAAYEMLCWCIENGYVKTNKED